MKKLKTIYYIVKFVNLSLIVSFAALAYNFEFQGNYWGAILESIISTYWAKEILK